MRSNSTTVLVGDCCWLVPYQSSHVATYHRWFLDYPELLGATGSEPLSIEEEYAMQRSWREDIDKCTFIVLDGKHAADYWSGRSAAIAKKSILTSSSSTPVLLPPDFLSSTLEFMAGDVNLFLSDYDNDDDVPTERQEQAEIDIMIANPQYQRKGLGRQAVLFMMLWYARKNKKTLKRFFCKINANNAASLHLFRNRLGFTECGYAACFEQYEFELVGTEDTCLTDMVIQRLEGNNYTVWQCEEEDSQVDSA